MVDVVTPPNTDDEPTLKRASTLTGWLLNTDADTNAFGALAIGNNLGGQYSPKLKFLFTVKFDFRTNLGDVDSGSESLQSIMYDLKTATRPNITIANEEVNFYGYRAHVSTKITFGTVRLTFYDDSKNRANDLLWNYMESISPMASDVVVGSTALMNRNDDVELPSSIGTFNDNEEDGIIAAMTVYHHYNTYDGTYVTEYIYTNPRIEQLDYDELDMSSNDASLLSVTFRFDAVQSNTRKLTTYQSAVGDYAGGPSAAQIQQSANTA